MLGTASDNVPRFITKKWIEVYDQLGNAEDRYKPSKQIRFKISMLRSDLCDFSYAYIVVKRTITLTKPNGRGIIDIINRSLTFKNNTPFTNCISKINNVDLDVVMPMYNLLEYNKNYRKTTGSLWNYYTDEPNHFPANNYNANPINSLLNIKAVLQEKHQIQIIKNMVKTLSKEIQRLRKMLKLLLY